MIADQRRQAEGVWPPRCRAGSRRAAAPSPASRPTPRPRSGPTPPASPPPPTASRSRPSKLQQLAAAGDLAAMKAQVRARPAAPARTATTSTACPRRSRLMADEAARGPSAHGCGTAPTRIVHWALVGPDRLRLVVGRERPPGVAPLERLRGHGAGGLPARSGASRARGSARFAQLREGSAGHAGLPPDPARTAPTAIMPGHNPLGALERAGDPGRPDRPGGRPACSRWTSTPSRPGRCPTASTSTPAGWSPNGTTGASRRLQVLVVAAPGGGGLLPGLQARQPDRRR